MTAIQIQAYEMFKHEFGESGADAAMEFINYKIDDKMDRFSKELAIKLDMMATKENLSNLRTDLIKEIGMVKSGLTDKIHSSALHTNRNMAVMGIAQLLAIAGAVIAMANFILNK